jgi:plastocyanin
VIPPGLGLSSNSRFEPGTLTVVIGINSTVGWNDEDTTVSHLVASVSVPPGAVNWDLNMTGGHSYCVPLSVAGTYSYEIAFAPETYSGIIIAKTAS